MSEKAHLMILKQGVSAWNEWRAEHREIRPELANAHIIGLDIVNADLSGANLRHADLRGTNLSGADLVDANLEGADFFRTVLDGADLNGANLLGARNLNCLQLEAARNWQSAFRGLELACGAAIPASRRHS
jgi:uncharacterized protein YjbI with pentapeptide repeats